MNILNNKNCFINYDDKLISDEGHLTEWITNEYIDNHGSSQQKLSFIKKLLLKVDHLKEAASQITYLPPKELITNNRKDILYRIDFLNEIINKKIPPKKTLYYQFVSDPNRALKISADDMLKNFITAYHEIKNESIKNPIPVGKYDSEFINTRYILNNKKIWKVYRNESKYQLIDGAHRLAIAEFLQHDKVPVKIFKPHSFEIPNYTDYIGIKETEYKNKII